MYANTELKATTAAEELEEARFAPRSTASSPAIQPRRDAGNDPACADDTDDVHELERWWWHAAATSGFADVVSLGSSYDVEATARAHRAAVLGTFVAAVVRTCARAVGNAYTRYRQRREAWAVAAALRELDDRTLHDLGFDRSEIASVAMEATGLTPRTRVRIELGS